MSEAISFDQMVKNIQDEVAVLWEGLEDKDDVDQALAILKEVTDKHVNARRAEIAAAEDKT